MIEERILYSEAEACKLLRSTGNLKSVQKLLGHTDIVTTARYAHAVEDDVRNMMIATESRNSPERSVVNIAEARGNQRKGR